MLLALWLTFAAPPAPRGERSLVVDGKPLALPASAEVAGSELRVDLLVSSEERTILATLLHRAWTPRDATGAPVHPEAPVLLSGRAPDLELEHAGARIDERLRLLPWRRPEHVRGLPLWVGVAAQESGVRPLLPPAQPPAATQDAMDRVLGRFLLWALAGADHCAAAARHVGRA